MSDKSQWVWMPHPGHFICARDCKFHLTTWVGDFIISTVGEYLPDAPVREILATSRSIILHGQGDARLADYMNKVGYEPIGYKYLYESMVFPAIHRQEQDEKTNCCPYHPSSWTAIDTKTYNTPGYAASGHMALCEKWCKEKIENHINQSEEQ